MKTKTLLLFTAGLLLATPFVRAGDAMEPPVPVRMVPPKYPTEMRREGTSGVVTVSCLIDEKGNVQEPKVEKASNEAFSQSAIDAVRKWKFKPAKRDGSAVSIRVSIPIQFSVTDD